MSDMRQWMNLYEDFESNIPGEFEESGWVYIESIEWEEMMEHEGLMTVNFAATHYNKEWTEAEQDTEDYHLSGMTVPPFIDEDQLWVAIANFLEAEGYKNVAAQFDVYGGSWYGDGISISVSDDIVAQGKSLLMKKRMKKRFKQESINESSDRWLEEDEFLETAIPNKYAIHSNPDIYVEWYHKFQAEMQDIEFNGKQNIMNRMNGMLSYINRGKIKVVDIDYDWKTSSGVYKIQHSPPKNFREK